jgi:hypothetical protein
MIVGGARAAARVRGGPLRRANLAEENVATTTDETGALVAGDIFQILLCSEESFASPPEKVQRNIRLVREAHPLARHHLLGEEDIRSLLRAHFAEEVQQAFDQFTPNTFRADLARYCLLLLHGGLCVDIGVRFVSALRGPRDSELVAFRDYWASAWRGNAICPGVLLAKAGRPELKTAIDMVVANVCNRYYGVNPIDVSGPGLFARAISRHDDGERYWFGQYLPVAPETRLKNFVFLTPDGEIVALGKSGAGGDLSYLGLSAVNNYVDLWRARQVYGEVVRSWGSNAQQIKTSIGSRLEDGIHYRARSQGFILYGPYCPLPAGSYRAVLRFAEGSSVSRCAFDVAYDSGARQATRVDAGRAQFLDSCVVLPFDLDAAQSDVECRIWSEGADSGRLLELVIEPR